MITCMNCEHGHHCPYTGKVDDLFHALMFIWPDVPELERNFNQYYERFEAKDATAFKEIEEKVRELYDIKIDFEFGYDEYCGPPINILKCEKYKKLNIKKLSEQLTKQAQRPGRQQTLFDNSTR